MFISLYEEQLLRLNIENIRQTTVDRIQKVVKIYLNGDVPVRDFCSDDSVVYLYKKGYGFLLVDNIKLCYGSLSFDYHGSWFDGKVPNHTVSKYPATKYKGYKDL